ncbi:MAG: hypothetical protein ACTHKG_07200 [Nocardioides sp.]
MRFLGGAAAALLVVTATSTVSACTTRTELQEHPNPTPLSERYPFNTLLVPDPSLFVDYGTRRGDGWEAEPDGILLRIDIHGDTPSAGMYSFADDGTVVRVADTSVTMSRDDLTTWRLSPAQLETVLGALDALGVREATPGDFGDATVRTYTPSGNISWGQGRVIGGDDPRLMNTLTAVTQPLGNRVRRWVPRAIGFLAGPPERSARSPLSDKDPFAPWPLDRGIRELAVGTAENAYGEERLSLCLFGKDAATVWRHLFTGVNTAYLRVDDGKRWELQSSVAFPDYVGYGTPCDFR